MPLITDPYTGAFYTLRYDECQTRITGWGFGKAFDDVFNSSTGMISQSDYPLFYALKDKIVKRFELRNAYKEISAETPDQWMFYAMQAIADAASKWEVPLGMMNKAGFDVTDPDKQGQAITYGHNIDGVVQDTPYGQLTSSADYVSGKTGTYHSGTDTIVSRNDLDAYVMMDLRKKWEDNMKMIIEGFDDLFIRITASDVIL